MSQGELSQRFDVDPSRATRLAKRLERGFAPKGA
jgi:DNA-binding MarR family transcriptional regulator